jgi:hypothetical protein
VIAGGRERLRGRLRGGVEHLDREVDLEGVVVAPASALRELGDDGVGVGRRGYLRDVFRPERSGREVAAISVAIAIAIAIAVAVAVAVAADGSAVG